jgi:hypothetical protein
MKRRLKTINKTKQNLDCRFSVSQQVRLDRNAKVEVILHTKKFEFILGYTHDIYIYILFQ